MNKELRLLILEDQVTDAELCERELKRAGLHITSHRVETRAAFEAALDQFAPDLIISDFSLPSAFDGLSALELARHKLPEVPFIFVSGTIGEERAVEAMKRGATDYVLKDRLNRLVPVVERALNELNERSARREAEEETARQRAFLRQVIDLDRNFIFAKDREGRFVLVNQALADAYGTTVGQILGKTDADYNPNAQEVEHFRRIDLRVMDTLREVFIPEERITDATGKVRWLQTLKRPIISEDGVANVVLGVATDITERKLSEEALRESEQRLDLALKASGLATWDWNLATGEVRFSRHWWRILGYNPGEIPLSIEAWESLTKPDDLARVKAMLGAHLKGSVPVLDVEYRMRAKSGEWRWIRTIGRVIERDANGRAARVTGTHGDITERKMQELRIARLSRIQVVLSGINSTIVRVREREELFREVCRITVEHGGFKLAWIGLLDRRTQEIGPQIWEGEEAGILADHRISVREDIVEDQNLVGVAIRTRKPAVSNDIADDQRMRRRQMLLEHGIHAVVALPLLVGNEPVGVLQLYSAETGVFDQEEMVLLVELAADISFALDHIEKAEQLDYLAYYDALTGLPNRSLFHERLGRLIDTARREDGKLALVILDLQRFRIINETLGRHAGDALLKLVAQRQQECLEGLGHCARFNADIFAVVLPGIKQEAEVVHVLETSILEPLSRPFTIDDRELRIATRCGIALFPTDGADADSLSRNAEAAFKKAKDSGERYLFYAPEINARVAEQLNLENRLRVALVEEQFILYYQPKVEVSSGRVVGLEALIRWNSPEMGLVSPAEFVPILEDTGMILEVGRWALKRASLDHAAWRAKGLSPPRIAVNVSAMQLQQKDFVKSVSAAVAVGNGPIDHIELEITESMIMDDFDGNIRKLDEIRAAGMQIAIDDFGTGYSSLGYLARLPVTSLKIDRSFVVDMDNKPEQMAIVSTIISLAHSLNLKVTAEGVESKDQWTLLKLLRCDELQGYVFSPPLPPEQVEAVFQG